MPTTQILPKTLSPTPEPDGEVRGGPCVTSNAGPNGEAQLYERWKRNCTRDEGGPFAALVRGDWTMTSAPLSRPSSANSLRTSRGSRFLGMPARCCRPSSVRNSDQSSRSNVGGFWLCQNDI